MYAVHTLSVTFPLTKTQPDFGAGKESSKQTARAAISPSSKPRFSACACILFSSTPQARITVRQAHNHQGNLS
jgi:hypothetical protein